MSTQPEIGDVWCHSLGAVFLILDKQLTEENYCSGGRYYKRPVYRLTCLYAHGGIYDSWQVPGPCKWELDGWSRLEY
jgi:hypothetical protein